MHWDSSERLLKQGFWVLPAEIDRIQVSSTSPQVMLMLPGYIRDDVLRAPAPDEGHLASPRTRDPSLQRSTTPSPIFTYLYFLP